MKTKMCVIYSLCNEMINLLLLFHPLLVEFPLKHYYFTLNFAKFIFRSTTFVRPFTTNLVSNMLNCRLFEQFPIELGLDLRNGVKYAI